MLPAFKYLKHVSLSALVLFVIACSSGSGCSSCAGCGVAPIPGGYPTAERIDNSAQIRLTQSGRQFIEANASSLISTFLPGGLTFPIPASEDPGDNSGYQLCGSNDCAAAGEIVAFRLTPAGANRLHAEADVIVTSRINSPPGYPRRSIPVSVQTGCLFGGCAVHLTCGADIDTTAGDRRFVTMQADIDFVADTHPARSGYTHIVVTGAGLAPGRDLETNDDIRITDCGGDLGGFYETILNSLRSTLIGAFTDQIPGLIQSQLDSALCTKRGEYGCPTGTFARPNENADSTCRYGNADDAECVPTLLGTDGQGDLGAAFLGSFSPGTHGNGQFLLASGGAGEVVNDGVSLFFQGGFRSTSRDFTVSPAHNSCVPLIAPPERPAIARTTIFRGNVIPGTTTETHVGIGIAEDYLNYAAYGMFDSGMLCLGTGTRASQMLSTGLVSALIASLRNLTFPVDNAALALSIRPQQPPHITVRSDAAMPLLGISFPQLSIDFYVFSNDRYIRFMTYTADLSLDANLTVSGNQLTPTLLNVTAANSVVTNAEQLTELPATLATALESLLGSLAGSLTSGLPAFELPAIMGIDLSIPEGGVRGVTEGSDNFIGIFANLALAGSSGAATGTAETRLETTELHVNPEALDINHLGIGEVPSIRLFMDAAGPSGVDYEFSYRLDGESWSSWTRDRNVNLASRNFFWQARHVVEARARVIGSAASVDPTPARVELIVDILAPTVTAALTSGTVRVDARDIITPEDKMRYRYRVNGGAWGEWTTHSTFTPEGGGQVDAEAMDEAGNVAGAHAELIRGVANPGAASGCACDAPGAGHTSTPFLFGAVFLLFIVLIVRRERLAKKIWPVIRMLTIIAFPLVLGIAGCSCNSQTGACDPACSEAVGGATNGSRCCEATAMCVTYDLNALCEPAHHCSSAEHVTFDGCTPGCDDCVLNPPLAQGQLAPFLDMTMTPDGDTVVSGYAAGVPPNRKYGDLVFGTYDNATMSMEWDIIDGVPSADPTGDPSGWRDGISAPGDDVGRYSSIASSAAGEFISYYDTTHGDLKLAIRTAGGWDLQTVDPEGDCGRFSSIAFLPSGEPAISYMCIGPKADAPGVIEATMLVAIANSTAPTVAADWDIRILQRGDMACRPQYCATGQQCFESGVCAAPSSDCSAACASGTACRAGTCEATLASPYVEDFPGGTGLFTSLAATTDGLGVVFYNRISGNLYGARYESAAWGTPFLIDGYLNTARSSGDCGIGASLFVDDGDEWHVSYVDGSEEQLKYAHIDGASTTILLVDDGASDGSTPFTDGRHVVGDDSSIVVTAGGEIRIVYQDATLGHAMMATRSSSASPTAPWSRTVIDSMDSTGYFLEQVLTGNTSTVATWYRRDGAGAMGANGVRVISIP
jgi:hypothetical protein